jgi:hypothetical protein
VAGYRTVCGSSQQCDSGYCHGRDRIFVDMSVVGFLILTFFPLRECAVVKGKEVSCGELYTGTAVIAHDHLYRKCDITNGQVTKKGPPYTGIAPVRRKGAWWTCEIIKGLHPDRPDRKKSNPCKEKYTGNVVAHR